MKAHVKKKMERHVKGMESFMTGEKRGTVTGTFPGQFLITGQTNREMKMEMSVKSLLLVCPIPELPIKSSMNQVSSTLPRACRRRG